MHIPVFSEMEVMGKMQVCVREGNWTLEGEHHDKVTAIAACALVCPAGEKTPVHLPDPAGVTAVEQDTSSSTIDCRKEQLLWEVAEASNVLNSTQREQLYRQLLSYSDIFASDNMDLGCTNRIQYTIDTGNFVLIRQRVQ